MKTGRKSTRLTLAEKVDKLISANVKNRAYIESLVKVIENLDNRIDELEKLIQSDGK